MDLRQPKPKICEALEIGETLETFKAGPFPTTEEVLRHFYYHFKVMEKNEEKKDANIASQKTAESLLAHWAPSALPLKPKKRRRQSFAAKKADFLAYIKTRFDISHDNALEIIAADKTLTKADREEDRAFLLAIRENKPHSLGSLDVNRIKRLKCKALRQHGEIERAEREDERNK
ncbi:Hypothetical protein FKW44_010774, partial [Caligus rogercresseyi]